MWYGHVFLSIGEHGSWVKIVGRTDEFQPYGPEHLNDPKYRQDLKKVGGEYISAYAASRS